MKNTEMKIFISYRSVNANEARSIVDLLSTGIKNVWFAENVALNVNYESFEKALDKNIENAINESTHAILITNHSWDKSDNCQKEFELISKKILQSNILQIYLPLENSPSIDIQTSPNIPGILFNNNIYEVLDFIAHQFSIKTDFYSEKSTKNKFNDFEFRYGKIAIWSVLKYRKNMNLGIVGREHNYEFDGHLGNGIFASLNVDINPFEPPLKTFSMESFNKLRSNPDRKAYHAIRQEAIHWLKKNHLKEASLHLKYFSNDVGYGVTYFKGWQSGKIAWTRYYFQWIFDEPNDRMIRIDYQFSIVCSPNSFVHKSKKEYIERSKIEFLKYASFFEFMVNSFEFKSDPTLKYLPTKKETKKLKWVGGIVGFALSAILTYIILEMNVDYPFNHKLIIILATSSIVAIASSKFQSTKKMNFYKSKIFGQSYNNH